MSKSRARRSRKRAGATDLGGVVVLGAIGAGVLWLPSVDNLGATVAALLLLATLWFTFRWHTRRRKRHEYEQALLAFRWREDMSPTEFEQCCADFLRLVGWQTATTKGSGDQGVDVVARKGGHVVAIQCKKYGSPIGNKAVQEVHSGRAFIGATSAAVVSNQSYTQAARELAAKANVMLLHFTDLRSMDRMLGLSSSPTPAAQTLFEKIYLIGATQELRALALVGDR